MKRIVLCLLPALLLISISVQVGAAVSSHGVIMLNGLTTAYGMNASLQVCGRDASGRAAVWSGGSTTALQTTGSTGYAYDINNSGTVVGSSNGQAAVWDSTGTMHYLTVPQGTRQSSATAVNDDGMVAGSFTDSSNRSHACYWLGGNMVDISLPNVSNTVSGITSTGDILLNVLSSMSSGVFVYSHGSYNLVAGGLTHGDATGYGISDNGAVAGDTYSPSVGQSEGFVWQNGTITRRFEGSEGWNMSATAVNSSGSVVGSEHYFGSEPLPSEFSGPFIWEDSHSALLNDIISHPGGYYVSDAVTIDDSGSILCNGYYSNHQKCASLLMTPEPSSIAALMTGIACLGAVLRRRQSR